MWFAISCFVVIIGSVWCQQPTVKILRTEPAAVIPPNTPLGKGGTIYAIRDAPVTLSCQVENLPQQAQVRWRRASYNQQYNNQRTVTLISTDTAIEDNVKYSVEKPSPFNWRLRIKAIQVNDEGNYTCLVQVTRQTVVNATFNITVFVKPTFNPEQTSPDENAREGDHLTLNCNATGRPTPVIEWTRIGSQLLPIGKERHMDSRLNIGSVKYSDRGLYRCKAINQMGSIVRIIRLDVRFKPVVAPPKEVTQATGYKTKLQCFVQANPIPSMKGTQWVKGALAVSDSSQRFSVRLLRGAFDQYVYELIFHNVQEEDYGTYRCQVQNAEGTTSATVSLSRSDTPQPSGGRIIVGSGVVVKASLLLCLCLLVVSHILARS